MIACFNIKTGDIEDAPALNALNKYDLIEKENGVYINATESDIKSSQRNPVRKCTISSEEEVLVIGGYVLLPNIRVVLVWKKQEQSI